MGLTCKIEGADSPFFRHFILRSDELRRLADVLKKLNARYRGHSKVIKPDVEIACIPGNHLLMTCFGPLETGYSGQRDLQAEDAEWVQIV